MMTFSAGKVFLHVFMQVKSSTFLTLSNFFFAFGSTGSTIHTNENNMRQKVGKRAGQALGMGGNGGGQAGARNDIPCCRRCAEVA